MGLSQYQPGIPNKVASERNSLNKGILIPARIHISVLSGLKRIPYVPNKALQAGGGGGIPTRYELCKYVCLRV